MGAALNLLARGRCFSSTCVFSAEASHPSCCQRGCYLDVVDDGYIKFRSDPFTMCHVHVSERMSQRVREG